MGMANKLGNFSNRLAEVSQPLQDLLSTKQSWVWDPHQERAFLEVKAELTQPTILALYDLLAPTKISADASSLGFSAVLLLLDNNT